MVFTCVNIFMFPTSVYHNTSHVFEFYYLQGLMKNDKIVEM